MPLGEQKLVERLRASSVGERFWQHYRMLRSLKHTPQESIIGAWLSCGVLGRGPIKTRQALAELLGISRHTLYRAEDRVRAAALALVMSWLQERVPDVDQAVYDKAAAGDVPAAKLFYQRARTPLSGEDAQASDDWAAALEQIRQLAEGAPEVEAEE